MMSSLLSGVIFMKVLMKPIEMIAWFTKDKNPIPLRYRIVDENNLYRVIKVDRVLFARGGKASRQ